MRDLEKAFPSEATLRWVGAAAEGRVVAGRRLIGGITSSVHRFTVESPAGARRSVVLRRWVGHDPQRGRRRVAREATALSRLAGTGVPAPKLIATSDGERTELIPALLMTRVPGRVFLEPTDSDEWMRQAAAVLPTMHAVRIDGELRTPEPLEQARPVPAWITRPDVWRAAEAVLISPPPGFVPRFVHTDYQHFNLLWRREKLTGIVDWTSPGLGPADVDPAHCRLNLAVLFSPDWAERFRLMYEAEAGAPLHPWFDLYRLTQWSVDWETFIPTQVGGRTAVDIAGMRSRVEQTIASTLRRL